MRKLISAIFIVVSLIFYVRAIQPELIPFAITTTFEWTYPSDGETVLWNETSVTVFARVSDTSVYNVYFSMYDDLPENGGSTIIPTVSMVKVGKQAFQGNVEMKGETWQVLPGTYVFSFVAFDVTGIPITSQTGSVTFKNATDLVILNINSNNSIAGFTFPLPGKYHFINKTAVEMTAIANEGYLFYSWSLDNKDYSFSKTILLMLDADKTLVANFYSGNATTLRKLTIAVESDLYGYTSPAVGEYFVEPGKNVTIYAFPYAKYKFDFWVKYPSYTMIKTNPYVFTMPDEDVSLEAKFSEISNPIGIWYINEQTINVNTTKILLNSVQDITIRYVRQAGPSIDDVTCLAQDLNTSIEYQLKVTSSTPGECEKTILLTNTTTFHLSVNWLGQTYEERTVTIQISTESFDNFFIKDYVSFGLGSIFFFGGVLTAWKSRKNV